jgi:radical SAM-linked protein
MRGDTGFPIRLRYVKRGKVRFVGHRDLARGFERAFRVVELPLAFTQGFSPRPKISLGLALGVGHESDAEFLDVELTEPVTLDGLGSALDEVLPVGVSVEAIAPLAARAPALQEAITSVEYTLRPAAVERHDLEAAVDRANAAPNITITTSRKGREVIEDLRPGLRHLSLLDDGAVHTEVATKPRGIRPAELLGALRDLAGVSSDVAADRVLRTHQWIERDGARHEPLAADRATRASDDARVTNKGHSDDRRDHDSGHTRDPDPHPGRGFGRSAGVDPTRAGALSLPA